MRKIFFIATLLLSFFCTHGYTATQQYVSTALKSKKNLPPTQSRLQESTSTILRQLPAFSAVDITGPVRIDLVCQQKQQQVTIALSPSQQAKQLTVNVQNHILRIDAHPQQLQATPIAIDIRMNQPLRLLVGQGAAHITAEQCGNPNLTVVAKHAANIYLKGTNMLHAIQNDSSNAIVVSGVRSSNLILGGSGQRGRIIVSGTTNELNTQLQGSVLLDARRLQTRSAHVLTQENAAAYVHVKEVLYGFAYDNSNIYYDGFPQRVMKDTNASGNVLQLH